MTKLEQIQTRITALAAPYGGSIKDIAKLANDLITEIQAIVSRPDPEVVLNEINTLRARVIHLDGIMNYQSAQLEATATVLKLDRQTQTMFHLAARAEEVVKESSARAAQVIALTSELAQWRGRG